MTDRNTCHCGNTLIWMTEQLAGECDACQWRRSWEDFSRGESESLEQLATEIAGHAVERVKQRHKRRKEGGEQ